ncbi:hypothetical protein MUG94_11495 [Arthrobacter gengyunqii]|uniref:Uncharacterized protein n=1 Tax=Arthrobacter gengyunqii TaxID=2886940 RepID=A0A9X1S7B5_9MICC|nr:hypothetical protein [Arthrobacter gengyunqii]MCC3269892.1 hypothetical protein [Arthrobacter gengyunqii]UOY95176.1 hypothetical protein MUG94_11495 [Arthrobacter gengyunqii]
MDRSMGSIGIHDQNYAFEYPEVIDAARLAIQLPWSAADRELVAIIDVKDADGQGIATETEGLHYSTALQAMFRYIPPTEANKVVNFADLKFPSPAASLSIRVINWKTKQPIASTSAANVISAHRLQALTDGLTPRTCILIAKGGQIHGE